MTSGSGGYARVRTGMVWLVAEVRYRHSSLEASMHGSLPVALRSSWQKMSTSGSVLGKTRPRICGTSLIVHSDDAWQASLEGCQTVRAICAMNITWLSSS